MCERCDDERTVEISSREWGFYRAPCPECQPSEWDREPEDFVEYDDE